MKAFFIFLISLVSCPVYSQPVYTAKDLEIFNSILEYSQKNHLPDSSIERIVIHIGKEFTGTPYVGGILDKTGNEKLVVDFSELDCVTFLESTIALSLMIKSGKTGFDDFCKELQFIRYRNGVLNGYGSRLHYFYDWIRDNEQKDILANCTKEIGGKPFEKKIYAMSAHRASYPCLKDDSTLNVIRKAENELTSMEKFYIPKEEITNAEAKIFDGDLIAFATSVDGMEIAHVGIAIHVNNELHLMHASSLDKKVEISDITLSEMAYKKASYLGIIVARIKRL